jgi:hypothetical protein
MARMRAHVALGLVFVVVAAGCGGGGGKGDEPTAAERVSQAAAVFAATSSFHLVYDYANPPAGGSGLRLTHAEGDVEVSQGVQKGLDLEVAGTFSGIPLESQLVIVGGESLLKDPLTGVWRELDVEQVPGSFFDLVHSVPLVLRALQEVERAGDEQVSGVATDHLRGKITTTNLASFLGNEKGERLVPVELWIGREDSLIRRIVVTGPVEEGEPDDATHTVELSSYGKSVTIERPVP